MCRVLRSSAVKWQLEASEIETASGKEAFRSRKQGFTILRTKIGFWIYIAKEKRYEQIADVALKYVLPFTTTYLSETAFSVMVDMKTKKRNRLQPENDLRLKLSSTQPDIAALSKNIQHQGSH